MTTGYWLFSDRICISAQQHRVCVGLYNCLVSTVSSSYGLSGQCELSNNKIPSQGNYNINNFGYLLYLCIIIIFSALTIAMSLKFEPNFVQTGPTIPIKNIYDNFTVMNYVRYFYCIIFSYLISVFQNKLMLETM